MNIETKLAEAIDAGYSDVDILLLMDEGIFGKMFAKKPDLSGDDEMGDMEQFKKPKTTPEGLKLNRVVFEHYLNGMAEEFYDTDAEDGASDEAVAAFQHAVEANSNKPDCSTYEKVTPANVDYYGGWKKLFIIASRFI